MLIREARPEDIEAISGLIERTLRESNALDYPQAVIERLVPEFAPARIAERLGRWLVLVATGEDGIIGTASLDGASVRAVFVAPTAQGRGVGRRLMDHVEQVALERRIAILGLRSSLTAEGFYRRRGFTSLREETRDGERHIIMEKTLGATRR
jgi:GNAT superfamily N-acetyltransferase